TIAGILSLSGGIDLGHVLLQNVTVLGRIVVSGAGESNAGKESVVLRNVVANELVVDSVKEKEQMVTILAQGVTDIAHTKVRTDAYLYDSSDSSGYGLHFIEMLNEGGKLQLAGSIKEVVNKAALSSVQLVQGSAQTITVDEYAKNSWVLVDTDTRVDELNLDVASTITGKGDIKNLNVAAAGSTVDKDILPDSVDIRPGVTDTILGAVDEKEPISSSQAAQLSAEPRILAGYPKVTGIAPTQAKGVFSANKPGTIYWAVSAVADGSVGLADLLENPVSGGNIFEKQAGTIAVTAANTEYPVDITKLLPDGSYYLSAVMVDDRGRQSPVKVIRFNTPDNTKPAFVGTPEMTKVTTDLAQVNATANKDCLLYYVVLPSKAAAPTAQQFKSMSFGADYGKGTVNMVKNLPTFI
ncbi:MAG: S-layer homology domain-containing protein, partial [Oscillospiraceae bacterium]|nr:S-layer homology domain-containing protein [Oscillospiraceae bacterium]